MLNIHKFQNVCLDFEPLLSLPKIESFLKELFKQAHDPEAIKRCDIANYKDYNIESKDSWSALYFGMGVEWYAQHFLNHYGHHKDINLYNVTMVDSEGSSEADWGVDGYGQIMRDVTPTRTRKLEKQHSQVYIQVKGTMNAVKEFTATKDRISNFGCYASSCSRRDGYAYQSRFILFTTGKGVYYTVDKMFCDLEVINRKLIKKLANDDIVFLNKLREHANLSLIEYPVPRIDAEAEYNVKKYEK